MSKSMFFAAIATAIGMGAASPAAAEFLTCERTWLTTGGFSTLKVAESWYPEKVKFKFDDSKVLSDYFGEGEVTKKDGRIIFKFNSKTEKKNETRVVTYTYIQSTRLYTTSIGSPYRYAPKAGAGGKCALSK